MINVSLVMFCNYLFKISVTSLSFLHQFILILEDNFFVQIADILWACLGLRTLPSINHASAALSLFA